jgi:hypothetical protein
MRLPPPAFFDHDVGYLRRYPNAAVVTPLGPDPLRVRLVLNSLIHKWIRHVAGLAPHRVGPQENAYRDVITSAILAGLPVLEARAAGANR